MHKHYYITLLFVFSLAAPSFLHAQIDSALLKTSEANDSEDKFMNMDAVYRRPMMSAGKLPVSVGGYMEANWQHLGEEGISEGHQFQFRRLTLFVASTISKRIKFLTEIEFEPAENGLAIEFAALDIELHPLLNLRGGMIVNPIGAFNQNHDGPKWEFTERPISATELLPGTWSTAGFGIFGKHYSGNWMLGYEAYLSSGFDNSITNNDLGKTYLPASKENPERLEVSASGEPLITGKIAIRNNKVGEIGLSYMGGAYNRHQEDGIELDDKRRLDIFAVDFNTTIPKLNTFITGEWVWINIDVPATYTQHYGSKQRGGFVDFIQPIVKRNILGWENASVNLSCRLEYVDWNVGTINESGHNIGEDTWGITAGLGFRPNAQTVLRLNYRHLRTRDFLSNPPELMGGFNFGISTYF